MDNLNRLSMACPAMPLCGLAITEAERGVEDLLARVRTVLTKLGFDESVGSRHQGIYHASRHPCWSSSVAAKAGCC